MSEYAIRDAEIADAEEMSEVIAAGRAQSYGLHPGSHEYNQMVTGWRGQRGAMTMRNYLQLAGEWRNLGDIPRARVATRVGDTAIVGVMTSRRQRMYGQAGVNLDFLFVDPAEQGNGLGSQLMDDLTAYADGMPQGLEVLVGNGRAQGLYEKYGFKIVPGAVSGYPPLQFQEMVKPAS